MTAVQGGPGSRRLAFSVPAAGSPRHPSPLRLSPAPTPESRVVFDSWLFSAVIKSSSACRLIPPPLPVSPPGCLPSGPAARGCSASAAYFLSFLSWVLGFLRHICSLLLSQLSLVGAQEFSFLPAPVTPVLSSFRAQNTVRNIPRGLLWGHSHLGFGEAAEQKSTDSKVRPNSSPDRAEARVRIHGDSLCKLLAQGDH